MISVAPPRLALAKFTSYPRTCPSFPASTSPKTHASFTAFKLSKSQALLCTKNEDVHHLFDGFSVLSKDIPWDYDNLWTTFAAYFFVLHIPLSVGGLSIAAQILHQSVLDPQPMGISALVLQSTETIGAMALLHYTSESQCTFSNFITELSNSEQRNWIKASTLGIGFLIGLVVLTSTLADRFVGPKEVNNPILKDILLYSPTSRVACFVLYCLIAPLLEEVVYRGFLLRSLASRKKWWQAVIISSFVFSICHFSGENSLQLFLIGCVLGCVYCWTGNLAAPFTVHSVYNATILLVTILSHT